MPSLSGPQPRQLSKTPNLNRRYRVNSTGLDTVIPSPFDPHKVAQGRRIRRVTSSSSGTPPSAGSRTDSPSKYLTLVVDQSVIGSRARFFCMYERV